MGYKDIKQKIMERIQTDIWPPGASLPGEIALAEEFGCARATVNRAMRELVDEGILERRRKAGTKVRKGVSRSTQLTIPLIREEITKGGYEYRYALVERLQMEAPPWLSAQLKVPSGTDVLFLKCMHYADERPFQLEERWINLHAVPDAARRSFKDSSPNEWLVSKVPFTRGNVDLMARAASQEIADFLHLPVGEPVFVMERTTWLDDANVTYARFYFGRDYKMNIRI